MGRPSRLSQLADGDWMHLPFPAYDLMVDFPLKMRHHAGLADSDFKVLSDLVLV